MLSWVFYLPHLVAVGSFGSLLRNINKEHSDAFVAKKYVSRLLVVAGFIGLIGAAATTTITLANQDKQRQTHAAMLLKLNQLKADNETLLHQQKVLVDLNRQLASENKVLVADADDLRGRAQLASDQIRSVQDQNGDIQQRTYMLQQKTDSTEKNGAKVAQIESDRADQEDKCRKIKSMAALMGDPYSTTYLSSSGCI